MNPLYSTNDSPNQATNPSAPQNEPSVHSPFSLNKFTLNRSLYTTHQYGYIYPFFIHQGVEKDVLPFSSRHEVRAFTMKSPFMGNIKMHKDFFCVPKTAILPNTWEFIERAPALGDDVPDDAICTISGSIFSNFLASQFLHLFSTELDQTPETQDEFWNTLLSLELFCSTGSLLYNSRYKINPWIGPVSGAPDTVNIISFDTFFDLLAMDMLPDGVKFNIKFKYGDNVHVVFFEISEATPERKYAQDYYYISRQTAITLLRDYLPNVTFESSFTSPGTNILKDISYYSTDASHLANFEDINIDSILAYQIAVSQYFVNTKVDYIYDSAVYRENFYALFQQSYSLRPWFNVAWHQFSYNGSKLKYDYFSQHYLDHLFILEDNSNGVPKYGLLSYIFGYRNSLRYEDYFVGSRTRPYAPGVMDAVVVDNKVSAIDVTKSIVAQRFRNAVVKVGNSFGDYLRKILHSEPAPDYHFPKYMTHQEFDVTGFETANTTSDSQGSLVTTLKSGDDSFIFQADLDMSCIVIGLCSYRIPRVYCQTKDRFFSHVNRYDMFNPMLQFIGDQPVFSLERNTNTIDPGSSFGYQSRNAEYKFSFSTASGGFVESLPSWAFICDTDYQASVIPDGLEVQSPDYIRSRAYEFDRYFSGFSGLSLGHKFHFIVKFDNMCSPLRQMEVNPSIL